MARRKRGNGELIERLECRTLLSFDPAKVGAITPGAMTLQTNATTSTYFVENSRHGYLVATKGGLHGNTHYGEGGEPWPLIQTGRISVYGDNPPVRTLTLRNVQQSVITRTRYWDGGLEKADGDYRTGQVGEWEGEHPDGIWIRNQNSATPKSVFAFENVNMTEIAAGQGYLWFAGSAKRMYFKDTLVENQKSNVSGRILLKLHNSRIDELIIDNTFATWIFELDGNITNQIGKVYVANVTPAEELEIRAALEDIDFPTDEQSARYFTRLPDDLVNDADQPLERPYNGVAVSVPASGTTTVRAENYDNGQEGIAFHDHDNIDISATTPNPRGIGYRDSAKSNQDGTVGDTVDVAAGGNDGYVVNMVGGEWMDYSIDVKQSGNYNANLLPLTGGTGAYRLEFSGIYKTGDLNVGQGGTVFLPKGEHIMRLVALPNAAFSADSIQLTMAQGGQAVLTTAPTRLSAVAGAWGRMDTPPGRTMKTYAATVNLAWDDLGAETEYQIQRSTDGVNWSGSPLGTTNANVTTFSDTGIWEEGAANPERSGVQPNTTFYYRVVAVDDYGVNFASNPISVRTGEVPFRSAPAAPVLNAGGVTFDADSGLIRLNWTWSKGTGGDVRGFKIQRSKNQTFGTEHYDIAPVDANTRQYQDRGAEASEIAARLQYGLEVGKTFYYRVVAYNSSGVESASAVRSVTPTGIVAPQAATITGVTSDPSSGGIFINWNVGTLGSNNRPSGFIILRKRNAPGFSEVARVDGSVRQYLDIGLKTSDQQNNTYRVIAYNIAGNAGPSNDSTPLENDRGPVVTVAQPTGLTATRPSSTATPQIDLSWNNVAGEMAFQVFRSTDGINWTELARVRRDVLNYNDPGLAANTTYYYRVRAYNAKNVDQPEDQWTFSAPAYATTTLTGAPSAPTSPTATAITERRIDVNWTDAASNESGFIVERSTDGTKFAQVAVTGPNVSGFSDGGLVANTQYYYRVRALTGTSGLTNVSSYTSRVSATTPSVATVSAPTNLTVLSGNTGSFSLQWNDNSNNETGFRLERSTDAGFAPGVTIIHTLAAGATTYADSGLAANTLYYYRIKAYLAGSPERESGYSNYLARRTQTSFGASPFGVGARIEAEQFDRGGEMVSYHDLDAHNGGNAFDVRSDGPDGGADVSDDQTGATWIGHARAGEWLEYTVNVERSGLFLVQVWSRRSDGTGTFHIEADGVALPAKTVPDSGGFGTARQWFNVRLDSGVRVIRLVMDTNGAGGFVGEFDALQVVERVAVHPRVGGGNEVRITGDAGGNNFHVVRDGTNLRFSEGTSASSTPYIVGSTSFTDLVINGSSAVDTVTLDMAGGNVDLQGALIVNASSDDDDTVKLTNASGTRLIVRGVSLPASGAKLDLGVGDLRVIGGNLDTIEALVKAGRDGATRWQGYGIGTSSAGTVTGLSPRYFEGVDDDYVDVKFTYNGDVNHDARINADDYFQIDMNFLGQPANPKYRQGDFNFDDLINADDYFLIDQAFLGQGAPLDGSGGSLMEGGGGGESGLIDEMGGGESLLSESSQANLTIDLRVSGTGGKTAQLPAVGQWVTIDVYATVTGDLATAYQAFQSVQGSFTSTNVNGGSAFGTLDAANVSAFDATGASYGSHADLDGDGDLDIGGTDAAYATGYWAARAGGLDWASGPGTQFTWKLATLWFTVTDLIAGTGTTEINFVKRSGAEASALWVVDEDVQNMRDGTSAEFTVGAPVVLTD